MATFGVRVRLLLAAAATMALLIGIGAPAGAASSTAPVDQWTTGYGGVGNPDTNLAETTITASNAQRLRQVWASNEYEEPVAATITGGVVYQVINSGNIHEHSTLEALSVRTGVVLWTLSLPANRAWYNGEAVVNQMLLIPFSGETSTLRNGVVGIDTDTHKLVWDKVRPAQHGDTNGYGSPIVTNRGHVYFVGNNEVVADNVYTGDLVWRHAFSGYADHLVASGGRVFIDEFVGGADSPMQVFNGDTGAPEWSLPGVGGSPVVVGNRLFVGYGRGLSAFDTAGCGSSACAPLWDVAIPNAEGSVLQIGAADGDSVFVTSPDGTYVPGAVVTRLSAVTGQIQWQYIEKNAYIAEPPIRAGNLVWADIGTVNGNHFGPETMRAWPVTATSTTPVASVPVPSSDGYDSGALSDAAGTLLVGELNGTLRAFRVPGT